MQQPGTLIEGKYEIVAKIREGGMGTIYKVRHRLLEEIRVVKVMQPHVIADADLKRRFLEEAKTAIRLKHPNICTIYDYAVDDVGTAYLVMEFIDGVSLADLLRSRGCPGLPLALEIAHQVLLALSYLHRKGVIHRDVAPDNLMLTHDEDGNPFIKLIDLGIAKAANRPMEMTATGVFMGKLRYASPEQYGTLSPGERLDGRSDLYGLGVVLYELLTGVRPFVGESPAELLRAHLFVDPAPFSESDPGGRVPPELRGVILKALAKKREDRYSTAEEFGQEIAALKDRYILPTDLDQTAKIVSSLRHTQPMAPDSVTPSAQDRLDRHFGAQATPSPSRPPFSKVTDLPIPDDKTAINPRLAGKAATHPPGEKPAPGAFPAEVRDRAGPADEEAPSALFGDPGGSAQAPPGPESAAIPMPPPTIPGAPDETAKVPPAAPEPSSKDSSVSEPERETFKLPQPPAPSSDASRLTEKGKIGFPAPALAPPEVSPAESQAPEPGTSPAEASVPLPTPPAPPTPPVVARTATGAERVSTSALEPVELPTAQLRRPLPPQAELPPSPPTTPSTAAGVQPSPVSAPDQEELPTAELRRPLPPQAESPPPTTLPTTPPTAPSVQSSPVSAPDPEDVPTTQLRRPLPPQAELPPPRPTTPLTTPGVQPSPVSAPDEEEVPTTQLRRPLPPQAELPPPTTPPTAQGVQQSPVSAAAPVDLPTTDLRKPLPPQAELPPSPTSPSTAARVQPAPTSAPEQIELPTAELRRPQPPQAESPPPPSTLPTTPPTATGVQPPATSAPEEMEPRTAELRKPVPPQAELPPPPPPATPPPAAGAPPAAPFAPEQGQLPTAEMRTPLPSPGELPPSAPRARTPAVEIPPSREQSAAVPTKEKPAAPPAAAEEPRPSKAAGSPTKKKSPPFFKKPEPPKLPKPRPPEAIPPEIPKRQDAPAPQSSAPKQREGKPAATMRPRVDASETKPRAPVVALPAPSARPDSESRDAPVSKTPAVSEVPPARPVVILEPAVPSAEPVLVRRRFPLRVFMALGLAATAVLVLFHPWSRSRPALKVVTGPKTAPTAAVLERVAPTAPPVPSPAPTTRPTAAPSPVATARPAAPEESRPFRQAAETAREAALRARQASERTRGQVFSPGPYQRGLAREAEGERLAARGNDTAAKAAFDSATRLFGQAEASAKIALLQPSPVAIAPRAEATRPPAVEKDSPPVTAAPPPVHGGASEQERIRETVRAYEKAWGSLDANLYARVFPSGVANFEQSLKNIRSQSVEIQIRRIEVVGTRATVEGHEKIVAQPRAGVEHRGGGDIVLRLEKRGDAWVILGRS